MEYDKSIPYNIHEFIGQTVSRLIRIFHDTNDKYESPHVVNLLWKNALIGADVHFTSWDKKYSHDLPGVNSDYFKELLDISSLPLPTDRDLEYLAEFGIRSPQIVSALVNIEMELCIALDIDHMGMRTLLKYLLHIFCDCVNKENAIKDKAISKLVDITEANLLDKVIHIFLGIIPQYADAKGVLLVKRHRWVSPKEKTDEWKTIPGNNDPATAMFVLLSVIESLQWRSGDAFYVIPNMYNYMRRYGTEEAKNNVQHYSLYLSQISMYLTAPNMDDEQNKNFKEFLRRTLTLWIGQFCSLVRSVNIALFRNNLEMCDNLLNWFSLSYARGLLGVAAPKKLHYRQEYKNSKRQQLVFQGCFERIGWDTLNSYNEGVSEIAKILISPWGRYNHSVCNVTPILPRPHEGYAVCYECDRKNFFFKSRNRGMSTQLACSFDRDSQAFEKAARLSRFCAAHLLQDIMSVSKSHTVFNRNEWYKQAFGLFYYHFDKLRHDTKISDDYNTRAIHEVSYYYGLIDKLTNHGRNSIEILDIGCGYGRLEKKLFDASENDKRYKSLLTQTVFWGLDISNEMKSMYSTHMMGINTDDRYYIGDMSEAYHIFGEDKFDLAILAFTTFGCYPSGDDNAMALKQILKILKPGGTLVIEQFNPHIPNVALPYWDPECDIKDPLSLNNSRRVQLVKTSYVNPISDDCTLYAGEYTYSELTNQEPRLIRRDAYCIRLYTMKWFNEKLGEIGIGPDNIKYTCDFREDKFTGSSSEMLMVIEVTKPTQQVHSQGSIDKAHAILDGMSKAVKAAEAVDTEILKDISKECQVKWKNINLHPDKVIERIIVNPIDKSDLDFTNNKGEIIKKQMINVLRLIAKYL